MTTNEIEPSVTFQAETEYYDSYVIISDGTEGNGEKQEYSHLLEKDAIRIAKQIIQHYGVTTTE